MYWGEHAIYAATSDNLIDWYPVLDEKNELMKIIQPRKGHFDSLLTECGPPAIRTKHGLFSCIMVRIAVKLEMLTILAMLIVPDSFYWMVTIL